MKVFSSHHCYPDFGSLEEEMWQLFCSLKQTKHEVKIQHTKESGVEDGRMSLSHSTNPGPLMCGFLGQETQNST